jgi:hypothetical protein
LYEERFIKLVDVVVNVVLVVAEEGFGHQLHLNVLNHGRESPVEQ